MSNQEVRQAKFEIAPLSRNEILFLICCCAASFFIQLYFLYKASPGFLTFFEHGDIANSLVQGKGFIWEGHPSAYRAPLYVFYLAFLMKYLHFSSDNFMFAYYIHLLVTSLFCIPVYKLAKYVFSPQVARISVFVLMTDYFVIFQNFRLLPEVFLSGSIIWLLVELYKLGEFQRKWYAVSSGILLGIGVLLRGVVMCFFPVALLWILTRRQIQWKKRLSFALLFLAFTALTLAPWTIRNYVVFEKLVPSDTSFGINFWVGNNERATGGLAATTGESICWPTDDMKKEMRRMNEAEQSQYLTRAALGFIRRHPLDFLVLRLKSFFYFWFTYNLLSYPPVFYLQFDRILFKFSSYYLVFFNLSMFVGMYGAVIHKKRVFLIVGIAVAFSALYSLFHAIGTLRYCSPLHPVLSLFVAYALYETYLLVLSKWRKIGARPARIGKTE